MQTPLKFTENIAKKTGKLLLEHFNLMGTRADLKPDRTVVTEADLAADKLLTKAIRTAFPKEDILSEEGNTTVEVSQALSELDFHTPHRPSVYLLPPHHQYTKSPQCYHPQFAL